MNRLLLPAVLACLAMGASSPGQVVDYPDSVLNSPQGQYPIYTGTAGNTIRAQIFCPGTFGNLPKTKLIVSRIGIQLAGREDYATFLVRAGTTRITALTNVWATNLPDQRIQVDLSGTKLQGGINGTTPVNKWVEWQLCHPFVFTPGDGIVFDFITKSKVAGVYCRTAIGAGVPRALHLSYTGGNTATTLQTAGGIKLRFVFQPLQFVSYGDGCPGTGSFKPKLAITGNMNPGQLLMVNMSSGLGGAPTLLFLGFSCLKSPLPLGGGCELLTPLDVVIAKSASGSGAGQGTAAQPILIPKDNALLTATFNVQWAQLDGASAAVVPWTTSNGGKVVIY